MALAYKYRDSAARNAASSADLRAEVQVVAAAIRSRTADNSTLSYLLALQTSLKATEKREAATAASAAASATEQQLNKLRMSRKLALEQYPDCPRVRELCDAVAAIHGT